MKSSYIKTTGLFLFGFLLLSGGSINAAAIPEAGSSYEEAVLIEPGEYGDFTIEGQESLYYKIDLRAGQELRAGFQYKCHPDASQYHYYDVIWGLYDSNRTAAVSDSFFVDCNIEYLGSSEVSWLAGSGEEDYNYYLKIECEKPGVGLNIKGLNVSVADYYDAQSQTDAGDSVESAMEIAAGEYNGFLSGEKGSDKKDVYKISIEGGKTLSARVTPPTDEVLQVTVLNGDREEIRKEKSGNKGAIVENDVPVYGGGNYYIAVSCSDYPECGGIAEYALSVSEKEGISEELKKTVPPAEEVAEQIEKNGEEAGNFLKEGIKGLIYYIVLPIAGGIIFLIVIIIVVVVVLKKNKEKEKDENGEE
jgi:hypothetical protein